MHCQSVADTARCRETNSCRGSCETRTPPQPATATFPPPPSTPPLRPLLLLHPLPRTSRAALTPDPATAKGSTCSPQGSTPSGGESPPLSRPRRIRSPSGTPGTRSGPRGRVCTRGRRTLLLLLHHRYLRRSWRGRRRCRRARAGRRRARREKRRTDTARVASTPRTDSNSNPASPPRGRAPSGRAGTRATGRSTRKSRRSGRRPGAGSCGRSSLLPLLLLPLPRPPHPRRRRRCRGRRDASCGMCRGSWWGWGGGPMVEAGDGGGVGGVVAVLMWWC